jgi:transposase InsO family protein
VKEWFTPAEFAALKLPFTPQTPRAIQLLADKSGWRMPHNEFPANSNGVWRKREGRGGGFEYRAAVLNIQAQARLSRILTRQEAPPAQPAIDHRDDLVRSSVWDTYSRANDRLKTEAKRRLDALVCMQGLLDSGEEKIIAAMITAKQFGIAERTLWNWAERTYGRPREDWLAYLVPQYAGRRAEAECDPDAWEAIKADYLRRERPPFSDCFRRLERLAGEKGWKIPSEKTLKRRLAALPQAVQVLEREGREALSRLYPAQERDKTSLHALEAVNADGHKFDVFVQWPGEKSPVRPALIAFQDVFSGMILSWRLARGETAHAVLLAFGDLVETWGIPEHAILDNGRAFASKDITGGVSNRYRFKVKANEPDGVMTNLGVKVHWATPYHGQAKPIERSFRDMASAISRDPRLAGAWTGNTIAAKPENYASKAIPLDLFERVVAEGIAEHNTRIGRRSKVADGGSLEQAFMASYQEALIRKASPKQRELWLLAAEGVTVRKQDCTIHLFGNRYWADALTDLRNEKVIVRFDPDALHDGVHVYRLNGTFIVAAECIEAEGFLDVTAARTHAAKRKTWVKTQKALAELENSMSLDRLAELHDAAAKPAAAEPPESKVVRPIFRRGGGGSAAVAIQEEREIEREETLAAFGRGLRLVQTDEGADG